MEKKHLENMEGKYVRWSHDESKKTFEGEAVESFGELGYLIY